MLTTTSSSQQQSQSTIYVTMAKSNFFKTNKKDPVYLEFNAAEEIHNKNVSQVVSLNDSLSTLENQLSSAQSKQEDLNKKINDKFTEVLNSYGLKALKDDKVLNEAGIKSAAPSISTLGTSSLTSGTLATLPIISISVDLNPVSVDNNVLADTNELTSTVTNTSQTSTATEEVPIELTEIKKAKVETQVKALKEVAENQGNKALEQTELELSRLIKGQTQQETNVKQLQTKVDNVSDQITNAQEKATVSGKEVNEKSALLSNIDRKSNLNNMEGQSLDFSA
ncbi:MAG: hypothetical protein PHC34_12640 [Candidatus Gastranaerophilales bacterium]|nr:hypothetical protein [Candidatus Gastranaerophilales bacterium]